MLPVKAQRFDEEHLYAVIINGGRNKLTNHERYWNDCSFLYQTLRHVYRIPKQSRENWQYRVTTDRQVLVLPTSTM